MAFDAWMRGSIRVFGAESSGYGEAMMFFGTGALGANEFALPGKGWVLSFPPVSIRSNEVFRFDAFSVSPVVFCAPL